MTAEPERSGTVQQSVTAGGNIKDVVQVAGGGNVVQRGKGLSLPSDVSDAFQRLNELLADHPGSRRQAEQQVN